MAWFSPSADHDRLGAGVKVDWLPERWLDSRRQAR